MVTNSFKGIETLLKLVGKPNKMMCSETNGPADQHSTYKP
jgi:hypothetical protein